MEMDAVEALSFSLGGLPHLQPASTLLTPNNTSRHTIMYFINPPGFFSFIPLSFMKQDNAIRNTTAMDP